MRTQLQSSSKQWRLASPCGVVVSPAVPWIFHFCAVYMVSSGALDLLVVWESHTPAVIFSLCSVWCNLGVGLCRYLEKTGALWWCFVTPSNHCDAGCGFVFAAHETVIDVVLRGFRLCFIRSSLWCTPRLSVHPRRHADCTLTHL